MGPSTVTNPRTDWKEVYRRIGIASLISELDPVEKPHYFVVTCPKCGGREANLHKKSLKFHCYRQNKCGYDDWLGTWVWESLREKKGFTKAQMAEYLIKLAGGEAPALRASAPAEEEQVWGVIPDVQINARLLNLSPLTDEAIAWFEKDRGIRAQTAAAAGVGYIGDPRAVEQLLREEFSVERLVASGILIRKRGTNEEPWFRFGTHRLLFPYRVAGKIVYVTGRAITPLPEGRSKELHIGGSVSAPWGLDDVPDGAHVHITEGAIDALTLRDMGFEAASIPGAANWKTGFGHMLALRGVTTVTIALDPDAAGEKNMPRIALDLIGQGFLVYRLVLPLARKKDEAEAKKRDVNDWFGKKRNWRVKVGEPTRNQVLGWEGARLHVSIGDPSALALRDIGLNVLLYNSCEDAQKALLNASDLPWDIALMAKPDLNDTDEMKTLAGELLKRKRVVRSLVIPSGQSIADLVRRLSGHAEGHPIPGKEGDSTP